MISESSSGRLPASIIFLEFRRVWAGKRRLRKGILRQAPSKRVKDIECLFGYEGNAFSLTGNVEEDLLNIIAVPPMQEEAVREFLEKAGADWTLIDNLVVQDRLFATNYDGKKFYLHRLKKNAAT